MVSRATGSELVQKYVGEGARMVRELFTLARSKKACIIFFDEVDAIGGTRFDDGAGGDNEVQRTMLEIVNQLDGFDSRGNIKVRLSPQCYCVLLAFAGRWLLPVTAPHDLVDWHGRDAALAGADGN